MTMIAMEPPGAAVTLLEQVGQAIAGHVPQSHGAVVDIHGWPKNSSLMICITSSSMRSSIG